MRTIHFLSNPRSFSALLHDIFMACLAWVLAYYFRFNFDVPPSFMHTMWQNLTWVLPLQVITFLSFGLYQGVWRFASMPDLTRILKAILVAGLLVTTVYLMAKPFGVIPRSVLVLDPILLILAMSGSRFFYRAWKEHRLYGTTHLHGKPVLLLGAGEAAVALVKDLSRSKEWQVVGLLDDDIAIQGKQLLGVKVLGNIDSLAKHAKLLDITHVIVAMPSAHHQQRRRAVDIANESDLTVLKVPAYDDLISGKVSVSQIRKIEVEDLLGREPVVLDTDGLHALIENNVVLVSGAGGSIGSELCRQIVKFAPSLLICFDISELSLYNLEQSFKAAALKVNIIYVIGDVKNEQRLALLMQRYMPNIVFHAAAYKHVPMMETNNVTEALTNNVVGTYTLAKVSKAFGVQKFVMVSTDKAVNPTNVMGASKRLAEMVCQSLQDNPLQDKIDDNFKTMVNTCFVIVRFGNVLGSSGSVIPKFREQIAKGGPITVTHPEITRYFMSIPEAARLVMQASLMGNAAEIFVLDMGESVKITDLARDMIHLSGLTDDDIKIEFTGLRPGEKLYEELLADDEHTLQTPHPKLRIAAARSADQAWVQALLKWIEATATMDEAAVKEALKEWVEEYVGDVNAVT